jgi:transposase-like protein
MSLLQSFIDKNRVNASFHEIQQISVTNEHLLRSLAKKIE